MSGDRDDRHGVKPLAGREKLRPPSATSATPRPAAQPHPSARRFVVERVGDDVFARAEDVSKRQLADLRTGRTPVGREIDLHGLLAAEARRVLHGALWEARRDGVRCLLVIHGSGHHSASGPVIKAKLADWLQEPSVSAGVLAFATAPHGRGGPGATRVLLRRSPRG